MPIIQKNHLDYKLFAEYSFCGMPFISSHVTAGSRISVDVVKDRFSENGEKITSVGLKSW